MAIQDYSVLYDANFDQELTAEQKAKVCANIGAQPLTDGRFITQEEITKLAGIQAGAEVNVQADWAVSDSNDERFIQHKPALVLFTPDDYISLSESEGTLNVGLAVSTGSYQVDG